MSKGNSGRRQPPPGDHDGKSKPEKREVSGNVWIRGEVKTEFPPDIAKEYITSSKTDSARENKRLVAEWVTLGFVALVAIFNLIQTCSSVRSSNSAQEALKTTRSQFTFEQRPWILVDTVHPAPFGMDGQRITVCEVNYGKGPAVHVGHQGKAFFGHNALKDAYSFLDEIEGSNPTPNRDNWGTVIAPLTTPPKPGSTEPGLAECGGLAYVIIASEPVTNPVDGVLAATNDYGIVAAGMFWYWDLSGNAYSTMYCSGRMKDGRVAACPGHNKIK